MHGDHQPIIGHLWTKHTVTLVTLSAACDGMMAMAVGTIPRKSEPRDMPEHVFCVISTICIVSNIFPNPRQSDP